MCFYCLYNDCINYRTVYIGRWMVPLRPIRKLGKCFFLFNFSLKMKTQMKSTETNLKVWRKWRVKYSHERSETLDQCHHDFLSLQMREPTVIIIQRINNANCSHFVECIHIWRGAYDFNTQCVIDFIYTYIIYMYIAVAISLQNKIIH